ncbi:MAG: formate dehydrogenase accessory sulfurtransferase FdhD [Candidatus Magnetomorum sp.]|nr:formate dehydrogenase accessory sulfurtransferase FdhD [Candidatus Magnetomorum sp.]
MEPFQTIHIHHMHETKTQAKSMAVTTEAFLNICINNDLFDQIIRTPGDEKALVAGLLYNYHLISSCADLKSFSLVSSGDEDTVTVSIRTPFSAGTFNHRRKTISDLRTGIEKKLSFSEVCACIDDLSNCQPLRSQTKSTHAAILFDPSLNRLASKEDVGRHNALDKVIGQTILDQTIDNVFLLVLSSRVSHELMMKILPTPVRYILSVSRPTSLAVELARKHGIHMACLSKEGGILVFTGMDGFC